ncbi:PTS sugar transporter subunit IIA [Brachybacterium sp. NBEC-018]|uniref:PTS sugar transporter subunit IIA n=1 Tax=Brachybacterium sp. NBEC-018 TaxID=2996004 RepID=UPI0021754B51|nr:PTS sugar transporter subunit IIA [Brachybacterium sp. NBEC-018]UVY85003.1 PTS sugar transporter subunit IIA [Brachybacterium sp. NBEC-018]
MSQLSDLVDPAAISLQNPAATWRDAITAAGALIESTGAVDPAYTAAMIRSVEEHGPYIVIAPGFALAHSRPDASVHRTAMSVLRPQAPIVFGHESNDPVTLVVALAAADPSAHQQALAALAGILADPTRRAALDDAATPEQVLAVLGEERSASATAPSAPAATTAMTATATSAVDPDEPTVPSKNLLLTVCGNGLGTSLFLKNTAETVLGTWGWGSLLSVEATDTISAKGRAKEADAILTSGAIAQTLGEVGVPVHVIENFTSTAEVDAALRRLYAV